MAGATGNHMTEMTNQKYDAEVETKKALQAALDVREKELERNDHRAQSLHHPGIEPGPLAWKARILPLDQ